MPWTLSVSAAKNPQNQDPKRRWLQTRPQASIMGGGLKICLQKQGNAGRTREKGIVKRGKQENYLI